jgi:hypothetical protein
MLQDEWRPYNGPLIFLDQMDMYSSAQRDIVDNDVIDFWNRTDLRSNIVQYGPINEGYIRSKEYAQS